MMQQVEFEGSLGHKLAARLDMPVGEPRAYALFAHCFTCGKDIKAASRIAEALTRAGYAVLRFDFTGLGMSEGEFANTNFTSNVGDLIAAADYMRSNRQAPTILIGHSLGGSAVIHAARHINEVRAVATIGAPFDVAHVEAHFSHKRETILEHGEAEIKLAGRPFRIQRQFIEDLETQNMADQLYALGKALLILHSPVDNMVGIENAGEIFRHAKHPKSFISLDNADHLLTRSKDAEYAAATIAAWATRYLPVDAYDAAQTGDDAHTVIVQSATRNGFEQRIRTGRHNLRADEPEHMGGQDNGPDPYALLGSALGACTAMTLQIYARHKELPLESVEVAIDHDKLHAQDCDNCETQTGKIDRFTRYITIHGDQLSDDQRKRLVEIADKCPVHKTLTSEVVITTQDKD